MKLLLKLNFRTVLAFALASSTGTLLAFTMDPLDNTFYYRSYTCVNFEPDSLRTANFKCDEVPSNSSRKTQIFFNFKPLERAKDLYLGSYLPTNSSTKLNLTCLINSKVPKSTALAYENMDTILDHHDYDLRIQRLDKESGEQIDIFNFRFYPRVEGFYEKSISFECYFNPTKNSSIEPLPRNWAEESVINFTDIIYNVDDKEQNNCRYIAKESEQITFKTENGVEVAFTSANPNIIKKYSDVLVIPLAQEGFVLHPMIDSLAHAGLERRIRGLHKLYIEKYLSEKRKQSALKMGEVLESMVFNPDTKTQAQMAGVVTSGFGGKLSYRATHLAIENVLNAVDEANKKENKKINVGFLTFNTHRSGHVSAMNWAKATLYGIHKYALSHPDPKIQNIYFYNNRKETDKSLHVSFCEISRIYENHKWDEDIEEDLLLKDPDFHKLITELSNQVVNLENINIDVNLLTLVKHYYRSNKYNSRWKEEFDRYLEKRMSDRDIIKTKNYLVDAAKRSGIPSEIRFPWKNDPDRTPPLDLIVLAQYFQRSDIARALEKMYGKKIEQ